MNLPNAITVGRIALTPLIAWLPFTTSWSARLMAFTLFLIAAVTDYWDGHLARQRGLVTDLGRLLDPLADKLLLVATLIPMYWLQRHYTLLAPEGTLPAPSPLLFVTPFGRISLRIWRGTGLGKFCEIGVCIHLDWFRAPHHTADILAWYGFDGVRKPSPQR